MKKVRAWDKGSCHRGSLSPPTPTSEPHASAYATQPPKPAVDTTQNRDQRVPGTPSPLTSCGARPEVLS